MTDQQDRSISVTFSMQISTFNRLLDLCRAADKNRSELLSSWIDRESETDPSKPAELAKEPT
jgi:hypothetical protein